MANTPNLKKLYQEEVAPALMQKFGYKSTMQIPRLEKIVVNVGCSEARENAKVLDAVVSVQGPGRRGQRPDHHHRPEGRDHQGQEVRG